MVVQRLKLGVLGWKLHRIWAVLRESRFFDRTAAPCYLSGDTGAGHLLVGLLERGMI